MKRGVQRLLQRVLGFERYLFLFARVKLTTMPRERQYRDLFHFLDMIRPADLVLDIGANIGLMTVLMSRRVPHGHVEAFEPIGENYRALTRIVDHYGLRNVTLHQMALSDADGELQMIMPEQSHVRMQGLSHVATDDDEPGERYSVPSRRLDDLTLPEGRVAAIKIDVENHEVFVFRGGRQLIERDRPLVYTELWDNDRTTECLTMFRELSYSVQVYDEASATLREVPEGHQDAGNYFLVPPAR